VGVEAVELALAEVDEQADLLELGREVFEVRAHCGREADDRAVVEVPSRCDLRVSVGERLDDLVDRETEARWGTRVALLHTCHGVDDLGGHAATACQQQVGGGAVGREEVRDELRTMLHDRADERFSRDRVEGIFDVDFEHDGACWECRDDLLAWLPRRVSPLRDVVADPVHDLVEAGWARDAELQTVEILTERALHARCDELGYESAKNVADGDRANAVVGLLQRDERGRAEPRPDLGVEAAAGGVVAEGDEPFLKCGGRVGIE
jgi:hypothetical protein